MMRWWLDRGVDGFRMDVINMLSKDPDKPEDGLDLRSAHPRVPAGDAPRGVRRARASRLLTVGETPDVTLEHAQLYTDPARGELDMVFQFEHVGLDQGELKWDVKGLRLTDLKRSFGRWQEGLAEARLELAVLEQPRPAAGRLALRRRLPRAPRARREDARHDPAPAPRDAVRLPGRGARDDEHALRPRSRRSATSSRSTTTPRRPRAGDDPETMLAGAAHDEPRQRAHADAVGRGRARRLHQRRAVDPGQRELRGDQRRGGGRRSRLGVPPLPAADRAAPHRAGRRARRLHDAAGGRRARLRVHAPARRRRAARARELLAARMRRSRSRTPAASSCSATTPTRARRACCAPWETRGLRRAA